MNIIQSQTNHSLTLLLPPIKPVMHSLSITSTLSISSSPQLRRNSLLPVTSSLSLSDSQLKSQGYAVNYSPTNLDTSSLNDVFARVGFPRRDTSRLNLALSHQSGSLVWLSQSSAPTKPVAFARATGDGVFNAVVWDVVVDPSFQGLGLGKAVMERVVEELREKGVGNIALYAEPRVIGFYRPLGFTADPDGIKGMVYSRKNLQKKR